MEYSGDFSDDHDWGQSKNASIGFYSDPILWCIDHEHLRDPMYTELIERECGVIVAERVTPI